MGSGGKPGSPDFRIGGGNDGAPERGRDKGGFSGGGSPPTPATIGGSKEPRSTGLGAGPGGPVLEIRVVGPEFPSSSSAETPMSCGKRRKTWGDGSGSESPQALSPIPAPIGRRGRWRGGGGGSPNRGTASRGRIPPGKKAPKGQNFGEEVPPKICAFGFSSIPPIGELADARGRIAPKFQSVADRSDRLRLKFRDHPRTLDNLPRPLGVEGARRGALPPSGARSWAGAGGGR